MYDNTNERPGIEESYLTASNTSDLTVEADRRGAGDVLIAAGWNATRLGGALSRLHTDWDRAEKPARLDRIGIERLAERIRDEDAREAAAAKRDGVPYTKPRPAMARAQAMAQDWYGNAVADLIGKLHALPDVYRQVVLRLVRWSVSDAEQKAAGLIRWWLNQTCPACNGTKLQVVEGTGRHSGKVCKACSGSGLREIPHGQEGRRLANYLDSCVEDWAGAMRRTGAATRTARNKVVDTPNGRVIIAAVDGSGR